jgi:hypothetical protein
MNESRDEEAKIGRAHGDIEMATIQIYLRRDTYIHFPHLQQALQET